MEENMIKISLEEYTKLLLNNEANNKLEQAFKNLIVNHITYYKTWEEKLQLSLDSSDCFKNDIFAVIKAVDTDFYKELIEIIYAKKASDDAKELEKSKQKALEEVENEDEE